ncbi:Ribbon-helix-helix protein, copG family [Actinopolyspora mzabensis]|uniref:Ribbon-helix-helix protein, copG family n=1 Tax=Actinopolyspora mzabensis TaxID=995066 RepID=A0A1G8VJQ3_ACTMZ|nr:ribbon-helix-helix protein, CopG family [Actinopolyspora mzabensis]SDJ66179.1 Ribbon-helix-helix protein, copG family [Actinopolyspora mzabensis]
MTADTTGMTLRLPTEMAEALRTAAFASNTSVNEVVKRAIAEYLREHARPDTVRSAFETTLEQHAVALDKLKDL